MACLPRPRQVMPPPAAELTAEEKMRQRVNTVAKRLSFASALNELSGQFGAPKFFAICQCIAIAWPESHWNV
jgi:hypothetical protein